MTDILDGDFEVFCFRKENILICSENGVASQGDTVAVFIEVVCLEDFTEGMNTMEEVVRGIVVPIAVGGDFHLGVGMELAEHVEGHGSDFGEGPFGRTAFNVRCCDIECGWQPILLEDGVCDGELVDSTIVEAETEKCFFHVFLWGDWGRIWLRGERDVFYESGIGPSPGLSQRERFFYGVDGRNGPDGLDGRNRRL